MGKSFDYESSYMGADVSEFSSAADYRLTRFYKTVKVKNGAKLLDVGCGGGALAQLVSQDKQYVSVYGCDISKQAIAYAKKNRSKKINFRVIKDKKIPFKKNYFDICVCFDVLEHVPDDKQFLNEIYRVLKPGGSFYLVVPCENQMFTYTWLFQKLRIGNKLTNRYWGHIHPEYTYSYIKHMVTKTGFSIASTTYSEHLLYQLTNVLLYFVPNELMRLILGDTAKKYRDADVSRTESSNKSIKDKIFMFLRFVWLRLTAFLGIVREIELALFSHVPVAGWKIHVHAKK